MPGTAPYTVTKHTALSFAEWLGFTYAHRGITVQGHLPRWASGRRCCLRTARRASYSATRPSNRRAADLDHWRQGMSQIQQFLETP